LLKKGYLVSFKNGLYTTKPFLLKQSDKTSYLEYMANIIRQPSYLSLEYVLAKTNLIPEGIYSFTSITLKTPRCYQNKLASFIYKNIKKPLFTGYVRVKTNDFQVYIASKPKALFDFLYLKRNLSFDIEYELKQGLRINWGEVSVKDIVEFKKYVKLAKSLKMKKILDMIRKIKNVDR